MARIRALLANASMTGLDIVLIWIPAHVGIKDNEIADRLAKQAISCGHQWPLICLSLTFSQLPE